MNFAGISTQKAGGIRENVDPQIQHGTASQVDVVDAVFIRPIPQL